MDVEVGGLKGSCPGLGTRYQLWVGAVLFVFSNVGVLSLPSSGFGIGLHSNVGQS